MMKSLTSEQFASITSLGSKIGIVAAVSFGYLSRAVHGPSTLVSTPRSRQNAVWLQRQLTLTYKRVRR